MMTEKLCILCGKSLKYGKVNSEHYVPATSIRNFDKLMIPKRFTHALRIDMRKDEGEALIAPLGAHKHWATVRTHTKCNSDASHMCQDMKWIIDHPETFPDWRVNSILEYYAHIWGLSDEDLEFTMFDRKSTEDVFKGAHAVEIYRPGSLWLGRLKVATKGAAAMHDYEKHTIWLGSRSSLEDLVDGMR